MSMCFEYPCLRPIPIKEWVVGLTYNIPAKPLGGVYYIAILCIHYLLILFIILFYLGLDSQSLYRICPLIINYIILLLTLYLYL